MRLLRGAGFAILLLVSTCSTAFAQQSSNITGTVSDAQGAVLPGVTVSASSAALIGARTTVTEANGSYRFAALPEGSYELTYELSGFQSLKRQNVNLGLGQTLAVDAQLQVQSLTENVTVVADSPIVDTQSTAMGNTLKTEQLIGVPTATDLWSSLARAPGVRMQGYDVGGSHKSEQTGYEAFGIRGQARVVTEGVDTTEGSGGAGFYQDFYAQNEVAVSAAGQDVTMNTPGAAVMSSIKSGGNEFKGLLNLTYEPVKLIGDNVDDETAARGFTGTPNNKFWEFHPDLGGPILKDKLWFFVAYNHFTLDVDISGVPHERATYQGFYNNYTTKETFKLSDKDTFIGYYQLGKLRTPNRNLSALTSPESTVLQDAATHMGNGKWQRVWSNRLFSEVNIGEFGYRFPQGPLVDYRTNPPRIDTASGVQTGAAWAAAGINGPFLIKRSKPQVFVTGTYFLPTSAGSHDLKLGGEWMDDGQVNFSTGESGAVYYQDLNGRADQVQLFNHGDYAGLGTEWSGADNRNRRASGFVQDRWALSSQITVTAGLRYDYQRPYYESSVTKPVLADVFPAASTPGATLFTRSNWSPRLGISWDPEGNGGSALKVFYGRYYSNLAQDFANLNPGGVNSRTYRFNDSNGNNLYDGTQELGALVSSTGGTTTSLDADLKVPHTDEWDVSYSRQFWGESSFRVAYVRKMFRDLYANVNVAREGQFTVPTTVDVTLRSFDGGVEGTRAFDLLDIPASLRGVVDNRFINVPDGKYNYDTVQFAFSKRFRRGLFVETSYDWLNRDELRANTASTNPFATDPQAIGFFQNVNPAVGNRQKSTTWQYHASGRYEFAYGIGAAANVQVQSGWPYARLIAVALPVAGTQTFLMEDIANNRADTVPLVGLRVDKAFRFGDRKLSVMFDLFNALNSNAVTNFALTNGASYNRIIATLQPRTPQITMRLEF